MKNLLVLAIINSKKKVELERNVWRIMRLAEGQEGGEGQKRTERERGKIRRNNIQKEKEIELHQNEGWIGRGERECGEGEGTVEMRFKMKKL